MKKDKMNNGEQKNIFGALKFIEQLFLEGHIPGWIFRNILKDYGGTISVNDFNCHDENKPPSKKKE